MSSGELIRRDEQVKERKGEQADEGKDERMGKRAIFCKARAGGMLVTFCKGLIYELVTACSSPG